MSLLTQKILYTKLNRRDNNNNKNKKCPTSNKNKIKCCKIIKKPN